MPEHLQTLSDFFNVDSYYSNAGLTEVHDEKHYWWLTVYHILLLS